MTAPPDLIAAKQAELESRGFRLARARLEDVPNMQEVINRFADQGEMLHRSLSELYETVQSVFLLRALGAVFLNPRKPSFRVTSKGETNRSSRISELGWPVFIVFFILILGVVAMVWRLMTS